MPITALLKSTSWVTWSEDFFTGKGTLTIKPNQEGGVQDNSTNDRGSGVAMGAGRVGDP